MIQDTNSLNQLGWYKARTKKGKRGDTWYPCRKCHPDEGIGLFEKKEITPNKILIRFLGYHSEFTGNYEQIPENRFVPLSNENRQQGLESFKKDSKLKQFPIKLRTEELAIISMWEKVEEREKETVSNMNTKQTGLNVTKSQQLPAEKPTKKRVLVNEEDEESMCSDDDDDDEVNQQQKQKKKELLRDGDVIEYYDPIGVSGNEKWLRTATILGIDPKSALPLNLSNGQTIDRTVRVKRVRRRYRGTIEDYSKGVFKALKDYSLRACGTQELVGIKQMALKAKEIRKEHAKEIESFWREGQTEQAGTDSTESADIAAESNKQIAQPKRKSRLHPPSWPGLKRKRREKSAQESQEKMALKKKGKKGIKCMFEESKKAISTKIDNTRKKLERQRRFRPHVGLEQLHVALSVWKRLEGNTKGRTELAEEAIVDLSNEINVPHRKLKYFLDGDERKAISEAQQKTIAGKLKSWLAGETDL